MRATRVLTAALLVLAGATVTAGPGAAVAPRRNAVTGSQDPISGGAPFAYDSTVSVDATTPGQLAFTTHQATDALQITVTAPTGGFTKASTYTSADPPPVGGSAASLTAGEGPNPCTSPTWSLRIDDINPEATISTFAAYYTLSCSGTGLGTTVGELRYQSTADYHAVTQSQSSWDFGSQRTGYAGWSKTFKFTNRGTVPQAFSAVATSSSSVFAIKSSGCKTTIQVLASCYVTVVPHPTSTTSPANGTLTLTPQGSPDLVAPTVALRVQGQVATSFYADAGAERVALTWFQLPAPFDALNGRTAVFRGTSRSTLAYVRDLYGGSYVDHVAPNHTYYYAVRPRLSNNALGDYSPVIAARPWPKYSAGMYHRLTSPARIVASHRVSAGHPFVLNVLGAHGVPSSHVSAVALNVTAASSSATTKVYVYPNGSRRPVAADVAVRAHDTRSNFVLARVGKRGRIVISTAHGSVPVSVDVFGYFSASGLSTRYGMGGAPHIYGYPGTLVDTKAWHWGALKHDYFVDAVAGYFSPVVTPHVSSLIVEVTAYGSKGSGAITGFTTNARPGRTSVLSYRPGVTTSSVAILRAGRFYNSQDGNDYPSVSLLNTGAKPVQLVVTVLGFVDDNTLLYGQRYVPTAPVHLLGASLRAGANRTIDPGRHAGYWTSGFNTKAAATKPSRTTTVSFRGIGLGAAPSHGQLHAPAHVDTVSSTLATVGYGNRMGVHNSAGTARLDVWSFGRFDYYPLPTTTPSYASVTRVPWRESAGRTAPAGPRVYRAS